MSGTPYASRLMFENSVANSSSSVGIRPNGLGPGGGLYVFEKNDVEVKLGHNLPQWVIDARAAIKGRD